MGKVCACLGWVIPHQPFAWHKPMVIGRGTFADLAQACLARRYPGQVTRRRRHSSARRPDAGYLGPIQVMGSSGGATSVIGVVSDRLGIPSTKAPHGKRTPKTLAGPRVSASLEDSPGGAHHPRAFGGASVLLQRSVPGHNNTLPVARNLLAKAPCLEHAGGSRKTSGAVL